MEIYLYKPNTNNYNNEEYNKKDVKIEFLYSDYFFNEKYKSGKEYYDFLFTYQDVKDFFPYVIKLWFNLFEKISPSVNLLIELLLKRQYPLEIKFLSAIQAVETFHRNVFGSTIVSKEEHNHRLNLIINSVPIDLSDWLKEKLAFSNEPNLRKRLKDIYDSIPIEVTGKLISNKKDFIDSVVNTRNYYTHYNSSIKKRVMNNGDILKTVEKLKILLICSILKKLQFNKEQIIAFVRIDKVYPFAEI